MAKYYVEVTKSYTVEAESEEEAFSNFMNGNVDDFPCDWEEVTNAYEADEED